MAGHHVMRPPSVTTSPALPCSARYLSSIWPYYKWTIPRGQNSPTHHPCSTWITWWAGKLFYFRTSNLLVFVTGGFIFGGVQELYTASHPLAKEPIRMYSGKVIRTRFILRLASSTCDIQVLIKVDMVFLMMLDTMLPIVVVILHMIFHMILHEIPNCHPYPNLTQQNALVRSVSCCFHECFRCWPPPLPRRLVCAWAVRGLLRPGRCSRLGPSRSQKTMAPEKFWGGSDSDCCKMNFKEMYKFLVWCLLMGVLIGMI